MISKYLLLLCCLASLHGADDAPRWWRGNLHTHSLWSDGDDFPEMITEWYKKNGYHFLAISDHNVLLEGIRWSPFGGTNRIKQEYIDKYTARFGTNWVELREYEGKQQVRLKPLSEYAPLFEVADQFLLIPGEEITDKFQKAPVHMNATNLRDYVPPQGGASVREVMQKNVDAVVAQAKSTGRRILPHLNHPNFHWGVTAEDLAAVRGEKFFEVYNGHPSVADEGDALHASTDRMWDIAICLRLASGTPEPLYGIAVDDSHNYHQHGQKFANSLRGWIMVRSRFLTPEFLIHAMEQGDFYASSGVTLRKIERSARGMEIEIEPRDGVEYRTEFIGTRRNFDASSQPVKDEKGEELPVTRRYSPQVGETLATVNGPRAQYQFKGDELYVRARIVSTVLRENPSRTDEREMAWTQPVFFLPAGH